MSEAGRDPSCSLLVLDSRADECGFLYDEGWTPECSCFYLWGLLGNDLMLVMISKVTAGQFVCFDLNFL